jgi:hypothetical protein
MITFAHCTIQTVIMIIAKAISEQNKAISEKDERIAALERLLKA